MSLRIKIMSGFGAVLLIFVIASGIVYNQANSAEKGVQKIPEMIAENNVYTQLEYNTAMQGASIRGMLFYKQDTYADQFKQYSDASVGAIQNEIAKSSGDKKRKI